LSPIPRIPLAFQNGKALPFCDGPQFAPKVYATPVSGVAHFFSHNRCGRSLISLILFQKKSPSFARKLGSIGQNSSSLRIAAKAQSTFP
jgi:hypothetical protein